jgi:hypothetical protein
MALRTCRFCGSSFEPEKSYFYWCSYACRQADPQDGRGYQRSREASYDIGYWDGYRSGYQQGLVEGQRQATVPAELFRPLVSLIHPDRHQGTALACAADVCLRWVLDHRPGAGEASKN